MKKIILAAAIAAFSFPAQDETTGDNTCVDVTTSLETMSESAILDNLTGPGCEMALNDAVNAIIGAGGDETATLTAAFIKDPTYSYAKLSDPTENLDPTAAGDDDGGDDVTPGHGGPTIGHTTGGGGGGSPS